MSTPRPPPRCMPCRCRRHLLPPPTRQPSSGTNTTRGCVALTCSITLQLAQDPNSNNLGTTVWDASIVLAKYIEKVGPARCRQQCAGPPCTCWRP